MDYRRFLGKHEQLVLPYFGGPSVEAPSRGLRVKTPLAPGWWTFRVQGRNATPVEPAEPQLNSLPTLQGHMLGPRLIGQDGRVFLPHFLPDDEPPLFAPLTARRWHSGHLLFDTLAFEAEAEEAARQALEDGHGLHGVKGVPASLRAAFAYALVESVGRSRGIPVSPLEVRCAIAEVAAGGPERAAEELERLQARRSEQQLSVTFATETAQLLPGNERVLAALASTSADLLRLRRLAGDQLEVTYRFLGTRFQSIVAAGTLRVIDAGVCLEGEEGVLTLESLPGVIREAVETDQLVITRAVPRDA